MNRLTECGVLSSALLLVSPGYGAPLSILDPAGPAAKDIVAVWWAMFWGGTLVLLVVTGLWLYAIFRRQRDYDEQGTKRVLRTMVYTGGIGLPTVSIVLLLVFGIPSGHSMLPWPGDDTLRINVHARQWAWEVHYPDEDLHFTDEIHLPAGTPVDIYVTSEDVIHGFWVPRLGGKIDAIPGKTNVIRLQADKPGEYGGQCAEYCGQSHAFMHFKVVAHSETGFKSWLTTQREGQHHE
ncbi:cytochrome c oxidase subunit II [Alteromonas sp. ASW11-19]|uniref:cytochrome-c oxidase n=1 Tax=Alteromonas salexigens TaxID=2982530 RepID=A0ABT2VW13_9ALTE|nr:cytochrome c oxidase subunit II [Alteromonas salexigens]MCU7556034.1 cytochrome c oxidase subunit II [Alteromonas salexigens]